MVDLIMNMIRFLFDAITGFSSLSIVSPATFNVALYNSALDICNNVVKPFGYTLLGALILFELTAITTRTEGIGQHGFEIPMRFIMKVAIVKIFLDKVDVVLLAISDLTSDIITGITYSGTSLTLASGVADMQANIEAMSFLEQIGVLAQVIVIWIIFLLITVTITAILYGRMIQIYVFIAIAPLPFATMANAELSSIAKNFIKSFAAVCIQGVLIFIVLKFYGTLVNDVLSSMDFNDMTGSFYQMLLVTVVLLLCMFFTGQWAKSITNAM